MEPEPASPAIEIKGLTKAFGSTTALAGVDLKVARGESVGLLGPNGAGKSTTLRVLSSLLAPDGGTVRVLGHDPVAEGLRVRARIGVVPQEIALYGELSAEENLRFFGELAGVRGAELDAAVDRALDTAGLAERRASRVSGFSGGMKRRLNLVAALLHGPEVLFLDEPTAGVDPQSRNHIFDAIERIRAERQVTMVYTTHAMGEVERMCDRIVIMDRGRCVADGTMEELRALDAVRRETAPRLVMRDPQVLERAAEALRSAGIPFNADAGSADLESIFLALTGRALRDGSEGAREVQA